VKQVNLVLAQNGESGEAAQRRPGQRQQRDTRRQTAKRQIAAKLRFSAMDDQQVVVLAVQRQQRTQQLAGVSAYAARAVAGLKRRRPGRTSA